MFSIEIGHVSSVPFTSMYGLLTYCKISKHIVKLYIEFVHVRNNLFVAEFMFHKPVIIVIVIIVYYERLCLGYT